jgi:hypothetical protein
MNIMHCTTVVFLLSFNNGQRKFRTTQVSKNHNYILNHWVWERVGSKVTRLKEIYTNIGLDNNCKLIKYAYINSCSLYIYSSPPETVCTNCVS